jgi:pimeloyl-ACP methyl ester carboxylesterase
VPGDGEDGGVQAELLADGLPVVVPAVPNRSLISDAAYFALVIRHIDRLVILVGHCYGGMVITNAARGHASVKALVYDDAFIPNKGQARLAPSWHPDRTGLNRLHGWLRVA